MSTGTIIGSSAVYPVDLIVYFKTRIRTVREEYFEHLFPVLIGIQMACRLLGVMQDPTYRDHPTLHSVDQEVSRASHDAGVGICPLPAQL